MISESVKEEELEPPQENTDTLIGSGVFIFFIH